MPYQVHLEMADGKALVSEAFSRFYEAQTYASQKAKELRPYLIAIREAESEKEKGSFG